jgi:hypothetical protein
MPLPRFLSVLFSGCILAGIAHAQVGEGWVQEAPRGVLHHAAHGKLHTERHSPRYFDDGMAQYHDDGRMQTFALRQASSNRVEIRVKNDYEHGEHQFEGWFKVEAPTDDASIMQVFGGTTHATAAMFRAGFNVNGGELRHGTHAVLISGIYGKWIRLNVIHDADRHLVSAYVDGRPAGEWPDNGPAVHYFKYGAYGSHDDAHPSIVTWRDVRIFRR